MRHERSGRQAETKLVEGQCRQACDQGCPVPLLFGARTSGAFSLEAAAAGRCNLTVCQQGVLCRRHILVLPCFGSGGRRAVAVAAGALALQRLQQACRGGGGVGRQASSHTRMRDHHQSLRQSAGRLRGSNSSTAQPLHVPLADSHTPRVRAPGGRGSGAQSSGSKRSSSWHTRCSGRPGTTSRRIWRSVRTCTPGGKGTVGKKWPSCGYAWHILDVRHAASRHTLQAGKRNGHPCIWAKPPWGHWPMGDGPPWPTRTCSPGSAAHLLGHHKQVGRGPQAGEEAVIAHLSAASSLQRRGARGRCGL